MPSNAECRRITGTSRTEDQRNYKRTSVWLPTAVCGFWVMQLDSNKICFVDRVIEEISKFTVMLDKSLWGIAESTSLISALESRDRQHFI